MDRFFFLNAFYDSYRSTSPNTKLIHICCWLHKHCTYRIKIMQFSSTYCQVIFSAFLCYKLFFRSGFVDGCVFGYPRLNEKLGLNPSLVLVFCCNRLSAREI